MAGIDFRAFDEPLFSSNEETSEMKIRYLLARVYGKISQGKFRLNFKRGALNSDKVRDDIAKWRESG
jgi:hypothetical protein